jgi:glycosyltransferase involved in cell wall biosynthesis
LSLEALKSSLSIVIPTLNPKADLLFEALSSIKEVFGAYSNLEVLVVDNGSKIPVDVILGEFSLDFDFIKSVRFEENLGFSRNLLRAAQVSSGDLIWFIGDDDLVKAGVGTLNSLVDSLSMTPAIALNVNYFRDGDIPKWPLEGSDESIWAGSALSSLIFDRSSFIRVAERTLEATKDEIWLHFLVFHLLKSERGAMEMTSPLLPQIAVRVGRNANWESHFGSQYLAGISCLNSLSKMCQIGIYPMESFADLVRSRLATNFFDVVTLTGGLRVREMRLAKRELSGFASVAAVKAPMFSSLPMLMPMTVRKFTASTIKLLGQLKSSSRVKLEGKRSLKS